MVGYIGPDVHLQSGLRCGGLYTLGFMLKWEHVPCLWPFWFPLLCAQFYSCKYGEDVWWKSCIKGALLSLQFAPWCGEWR